MIVTRTKAKSASIEATITRADGRVEHIGVIAYYHRNPLRRWAWKLQCAGRTFVRDLKGLL